MLFRIKWFFHNHHGKINRAQLVCDKFFMFRKTFMKKKKESENRYKKTVMSLNFSSSSTYLVLCVLSWVPLCPKCIQMIGLLVYSNMKKGPKFCVR